MRRTKPDRWERLTAKYSYIDVGHGDQPDDYAVDASMVAKLLRREHRAVVRMVKAYKELCRPHDTDRCVEWQVAWHYIENTCDDILARLEARAR